MIANVKEINNNNNNNNNNNINNNNKAKLRQIIFGKLWNTTNKRALREL